MDEEDIWVWTADVSSIYTVRLVYKVIVSNENLVKEEFFQKTVGQRCSPKGTIFCLEIITKRLSALQNLARHDIISLNESIYGLKNEDTTHILGRYIVWSSIFRWWDVKPVTQCSKG